MFILQFSNKCQISLSQDSIQILTVVVPALEPTQVKLLLCVSLQSDHQRAEQSNEKLITFCRGDQLYILYWGEIETGLWKHAGDTNKQTNNEWNEILTDVGGDELNYWFTSICWDECVQGLSVWCEPSGQIKSSLYDLLNYLARVPLQRAGRKNSKTMHYKDAGDELCEFSPAVYSLLFDREEKETWADDTRLHWPGVFQESFLVTL